MEEKLYAVILASGVSRRFGRNKLILNIDGETVIKRAVSPFLIDGIERVFVVAGMYAESLKKELEGIPGVEIVENPGYREGMSSSVKAVLSRIEGANGVFFHLGDKPFVKSDLVRSMNERYAKGDGKIIVPVYDNKKGHPVLIDIKPYIEEMRSLTGDKGLREVIEKHRADVLFMEGDEGCVFDIDTPDDLDILKRRRYRIEEGEC